jgi:hypothetical protein
MLIPNASVQTSFQNPVKSVADLSTSPMAGLVRNTNQNSPQDKRARFMEAIWRCG